MKFQGILTPTITPLDEKECIDEISFIRSIDRLIDNGIHGIFLLGSSGEFTALTNAERQRAIEITVNAVGGRVPIICGAMDSSTKRVLQNVEMIQNHKISAIATTVPFYYSPTTNTEIRSFYKTVAENSDLPILIYNIPILVKTMMQPEIVAEIASENEKIIGIKDSTGDWTTFLKLHNYLGKNDHFSILIGSHTMAGAAIAHGADGAVISISNIDPVTTVKLYESAKDREMEKVAELSEKLLDLGKLYSFGSGVSCLKASMSILGVCAEKVTHPLQPIGKSAKLEIKTLFEKHDLC